MSTSASPPTVYHGPSLDREWDSLDPLDGYNIVLVTADNAERFGYRVGEHGLKVRYFRKHVADAEDLAGAIAAIMAEMCRHLVLIEEPLPYGQTWDVALARHDDAE